MVLHGRNTTAATKAKNDRPKRIEDRRSSHYYDVKNSPEPHHEVPINTASNYKETHTYMCSEHAEGGNLDRPHVVTHY